MITEIQGLPPIVIQNFPELQNNIKKGIEGSTSENPHQTENPKPVRTEKSATIQTARKGQCPAW